jgi:hypothetical protein
MSCTNPNCNAGCGCNNCCPPVTPPTPPTPPTCVGTQCEELYDAACVEYTGPALTCLNVQPNTNLNSIIQTIALNICNCCSKSQCVSPFKLFFERFKAYWDASYAADNTLSFNDLFNTFMVNGLVVKKCQYCCPDSFMYTLAIGRGGNSYVNGVYNSVSGIQHYEIPNVNSWTGFNNAATALIASIDPTCNGDIEDSLTVNDVHEWGGFNNISGIKDLNIIFAELFTKEQITTIICYLNSKGSGLSVVCDSQTGNIVMGATGPVITYMRETMHSPIND